jgi:serine/threonine protein kinase
MRYVEGTDLGSVLRRDGALDPDRAVDVVSQVASALDAAHSRELIHRDVKPANILIASGEGGEDPGHAYLSDFGVNHDDGTITKIDPVGGTVLDTIHVAPRSACTPGQAGRCQGIFDIAVGAAGCGWPSPPRVSADIRGCCRTPVEWARGYRQACNSRCP